MTKMRCLIFGGGGFLGSHLCDALLAKGYSVRIFDRPNLKRFREFLTHEDVEWIEGDFLNQEDVVRAVSGCDIIYHLVSTTLPKSSNENPVYDIETNVVSTLHLLNLICKGDKKKIIFISSGGTVYGVPKSTIISEDHPTDPICSYGIGKLTIEKYLQLYHKLFNLDYTILRLSNPYGERQRATAAQGAVAVFVYKALKSEMIEIWGDGSIVRDYLYISDAVEAMIAAIDFEKSPRVFNIGSGVGYSLNEILKEIESIIDRPIARHYKIGRMLDVPTNVLDIERAKNFLCWKPQIDFRQGLARAFTWQKNNCSADQKKIF